MLYHHEPSIATCHMPHRIGYLPPSPDYCDCHLPTLRWRVAFPMKRVWISPVSELPFPGPMHSTSSDPRELSVNAKTSVLSVCLAAGNTHRCCLIGSESTQSEKLKEILLIVM